MSRSCLGPVVRLYSLSIATTRQQSFVIYITYSINEGFPKYPSAKVGKLGRFDIPIIGWLFRRFIDLFLQKAQRNLAGLAAPGQAVPVL